MIIGGIAVIVRGIPRQTGDVDATVAAEGLDLEDMIALLARHGIRGRIPDLLDFARKHQVLLLRHEPGGIPIEVILAWLPFEMEAIGRAEMIDLGTTRLPVASAEDLVVYKCVAWRTRDRADVERLLSVHGANMNLARVRGILAAFAEAMEDPTRLTEFDALLERVQGKT